MQRLLSTFLPLYLTCITFVVIGQEQIKVAEAQIQDSDTVIVSEIQEVLVFTKKSFANSREQREFERLKKNTIKVYPYVEMAVEIYKQLNEDIDGINRKRQKKKYVKVKEKELRVQFEEEVRNMSRTQGNILIKLINRETGNNCYTIIKQLKGPFTAFIWNMVAKMYDHEFKAEYVPEENEDLEFIVTMIKNE